VGALATDGHRHRDGVGMSVPGATGLDGSWAVRPDLGTARLQVGVPEVYRQHLARQAGRRAGIDTSEGAALPPYLAVSCDGRRVILQTTGLTSDDTFLRVHPTVCTSAREGARVSPAGVWAFRLYRISHAPGSYSAVAVAAGTVAIAINLSLAAGKTFAPPPIVVSDGALVAWQIIAALATLVALVVPFWSKHVVGED
jgi:hypothetical protein